jgi:predicted CXXCH cytochrome family protein
MVIGKRKGIVIGIGMTVLMFAAACSVQDHFRTLSFFFDGVPSPEAVRQAALVDSLKAAAKDTSAILAKTATPTSFVHQPYLEKKCDECHNTGSMGSQKQLMPGLCYQCHTDFGTQYTFEHGPSAGGYCTQCHHPHQSKEEKLLVRTGNGLCLQCHDTLLVVENPFHKISGETNCITCHNPHGSNNRFLMQPGACYQCHESFSEKYTVLHGPVAIGHCAECHLPHSAGSEKLLVRTGRELCLQCHDSRQVMTNKNHEGTEDASCTDCHNPHGGSDKFMLN